MSEQDENVTGEAESQEQAKDQERPEDRAAEDQEPESKANAEAAKYRHRLREAESERDALLEQLAVLRRAAVDAEVTNNYRVAAEGFWASGVQLEDLLDDKGGIDLSLIHISEPTRRS